ncbi:MAG: insulinase family protein [Clostridiales bacterium]|nr:insulinase family protein [Clostridiales bacterium]
MNKTVLQEVRESEFLKEKYYYLKHHSGLDIYVFPKNLTTTYALFGTKYGSIDNKFSTQDGEIIEVPDGIAHFLEHKMFEDEEGIDTFARYAKTGASANAYTSRGMTAYLFSCTDNFSSSLEILLDSVTSPYFTPENVKKEQGIIGQEIGMYDDNPRNRLYYGLLSALYESHPVRIDICGTVSTIAKITDKILYHCYNTFYNLSNMALSVCGNVTPEEILAVADKVLKPQEPVEITRFYPKEKPTVFRKRAERRMQVAKPLFSIGIKDTDISKDAAERAKKGIIIRILNNMLYGKTSAFYNELYEQGLITPSFGYFNDISESYAFNMITGESPNPDEVYRRFVHYIDDLQKNGLDREAFDRCHRVELAEFVKIFDSTEEIANVLLSLAFAGVEIFEYADIINSITFEDVTRVFHSCYNPEYYAMSVIIPIDEQ